MHPPWPTVHAAHGTGLEIAKALRMHYAFLCEFEELHSPLRDALTQVQRWGSLHPSTGRLQRSRRPEINSHVSEHQGGGVHGNAILSKFPLTDCRAIEHRWVPGD